MNLIKAARRAALACTAAVLLVGCAVPTGASDARASLGPSGQYITDDGAYGVYVLSNDPGAVGIAQVLQGADAAPSTVMLNGLQVPVHVTDTSVSSGAVLLPLPLQITEVKQCILDGTNAIRGRVGAGSVVLSDLLSRAALVRATEMAAADEMNHTRPNGEGWPTVISGYGSASAENIAMSGDDLDTAAPVSMDLWEHSEVHYNNIVNPEYTNIGVGCARSASGLLYICQLFSNGDPGMDPSDVTIDTVKLDGPFTPNPDSLQDASAAPGVDPEPDTVPAIVVETPLDPSLLLASGSFEVSVVGDTPVVAGMSVTSPTTVDELLAGLRLADGRNLQLTDESGEVRSGDALAATGDHVWASMDDGFAPTGIVVLVQGDVLGTGTNSLSQLVRVAKAYTGQSLLTGVHLAAADSNGDKKIGLAELVAMARSLG